MSTNIKDVIQAVTPSSSASVKLEGENVSVVSQNGCITCFHATVNDYDLGGACAWLKSDYDVLVAD